MRRTRRPPNPGPRQPPGPRPYSRTCRVDEADGQHRCTPSAQVRLWSGWSLREVAVRVGLPADGLSLRRLSDMEHGRRPAGYRRIVDLLCALYGQDEEDLWPVPPGTEPGSLQQDRRLQRCGILPRSTRRALIVAAEGRAPATPEDLVAGAEVLALLRSACCRHLPPRQYLVIWERMVYGRTLDDVARTIGRTRERVRQIEVKGLRRLRHGREFAELRRELRGEGA